MGIEEQGVTSYCSSWGSKSGTKWDSDVPWIGWRPRTTKGVVTFKRYYRYSMSGRVADQYCEVGFPKLKIPNINFSNAISLKILNI